MEKAKRVNKNKTNKGRWSPEMEGIFIDYIRERRHLWCPQHPHFKKNTLKNQSYIEIGEEMVKKWPEYADLFTYENLLSKFGALRSYYRRETKKLQDQQKSGSAGVGFISPWYNYEKLRFLNDSFLPEESEDNLPQYQEIVVPVHLEYDSSTVHIEEIIARPEDVQLPGSLSSFGCVESELRTNTSTTTANTSTSNASMSNASTPTARSSNASIASNLTAAKGLKRNFDKNKKRKMTNNDFQEIVKKSLESAESAFNSLLKPESADDHFGLYIGKTLSGIPEGLEKQECKMQIMLALNNLIQQTLTK